MSYAAEPYLHVADQVLTALTGGAAREVHRFFAGANSFSFEVPAAKVLPDSVRVIGQAQAAFFAFRLGTDFAIGGDGLLRFLASPTDPSQPAKGATWPDEATEFYVSYYHADSFQAPLTDRNVGSLTRTLGEAFARELAVLRSQLELIYKSGFVDTAEGSALDMVVALLGLSRKTRDFASGTVRFFRDTPAPADVFIPAGTKVSTALPPPRPVGGLPGSPPSAGPAAAQRPVSFLTSADRTMRRGQLGVEAPIRAEVKGAPGVVDAGTITVVNQTVLGVNHVTNDAATVFGGAGESDEELRGRAKTVAERAGRATPRALLNALTELSSFKANDVSVTEDLIATPGVVSVSVAADPTPQLASDVHDAILQTRAAGIRVVTNLDPFLSQLPVAGASSGTVRDSPPSSPPVSSPPSAGDGFKYPLQAAAVVFPEDPRITGAPKAALQQAISGTIVAGVEASTVGGVIVYNRLTSDLMGIPGVYDVVLDIFPKSAPSGGSKHNISVPGPPDPKRATIDPADIKVVFAGAPVFFDFEIAVRPKAGATLDAIRTEIKTQLAAYFAHLPVANTVEGTGLMAKLGGSHLFDLDILDLGWTAEFAKAGLTIRNQGGATAPTTFAEGDQAILRAVTVTQKA